MVFQAAKTRESQLRSARLRISLTKKRESHPTKIFDNPRTRGGPSRQQFKVWNASNIFNHSREISQWFNPEISRVFSELSAWEKCGPATMFSDEPCSEPSCVLLDGLIPLIRILTMDSDSPRLGSLVHFNPIQSSTNHHRSIIYISILFPICLMVKWFGNPLQITITIKQQGLLNAILWGARPNERCLERLTPCRPSEKRWPGEILAAKFCRPSRNGWFNGI